MPRSLLYSPSSSERVLTALHPLWAGLARLFPSMRAAPKTPVPHPSAMLTEQNAFYRMIFPRFFARISVDDAAVERLRAAAEGATVVYVSRTIGQLEYSYFNHLFLERGLPLSRFANALTLRRWMRPADYWRTICAQQREIDERGRPMDPVADGKLTAMIRRGSSVLIRIPPSEMEDDELFFTGSLHALSALLEAQQAEGRPVAVVPLDFLWSRRPPQARKSLADILFGEKENPGRIRKFVLFWRNYKRRAQASIGAPIDLAGFLAENADAERAEQARRLRSRIVAGLAAQRRAVTGPPQKPRSWFLQEILTDEALDRLICELAAQRQKPADHLRTLAKRYANEIVADLDYTYLELLERLMGRTLLRLFESLNVDADGLSRLREQMARGPVILVPNHKSHTDYLILSSLLYQHGLQMPHIAAGANLSFWPLGRIFRRCGAFFIRRTFKGNDLYRFVLQTYLKVLLREGCCQEFFIEGGRSRSGKLMAPKMGMLRMLTAAAKSANVHDVTYVPVALTYDRVIEHRSYERELVGNAKEQEGTGKLIRLTKYLRRKSGRYGSIFVRFGPALTVENTGDERADVARLAQRICNEINRRVVVTPASVAAAALLACNRPGVRDEEYRRMSEVLLQGLAAKGAEIPPRLLGETKAVLERALEQLSSQRLLLPRRDSLEPFHAVEPSRRMALAYYRNSILHYMATAGTLACLLQHHQRRGSRPGEAELAAELQAASKLLSRELRFAVSRAMPEHVSRGMELLIGIKAALRDPDGAIRANAEEPWRLEAFAAQIRPLAETLSIALRYARERCGMPQEEKALLAELMRAGEDLLMLQTVRFREHLTQEGFANALLTLADHGILVREEQQSGNKRRVTFAFSQDRRAAENLQVDLEKLL